MTRPFKYSGNLNFSTEHKIAFLCSRKCPAQIVLKSYDWALAQRDREKCVVSGFHSKIEQDVFHFLLKGNQPLILALARGLMKRYTNDIQIALSENRLLIVTPFDASTKRITAKTAKKRNQFMCNLADEVFVAYAMPNGNLLTLIKDCLTGGKKVYAFNVAENAHLFKLGVEKYKISSG